MIEKHGCTKGTHADHELDTAARVEAPSDNSNSCIKAGHLLEWDENNKSGFVVKWAHLASLLSTLSRQRVLR